MKKHKKDKDNLKGLIAVLLIIIIISFALGSFLRNSAKPEIKEEYSNGFTFKKIGNFWYTTIKNPILDQEYEVEFRYAPSEVKDIKVTGDPKEFFALLNLNNLTAAYFTFSPLDNLTSYTTLAAADLAKFTNVLNGVTLIAACTLNETSACHTRPIVACEDKTSFVIHVKSADTPSILMKDNCLTIQGKDEDLTRAYTKVLFIWYNIL